MSRIFRAVAQHTKHTWRAARRRQHGHALSATRSPRHARAPLSGREPATHLVPRLVAAVQGPPGPLAVETRAAWFPGPWDTPNQQFLAGATAGTRHRQGRNQSSWHLSARAAYWLTWDAYTGPPGRHLGTEGAPSASASCSCPGLHLWQLVCLCGRISAPAAQGPAPSPAQVPPGCASGPVGLLQATQFFPAPRLPGHSRDQHTEMHPSLPGKGLPAYLDSCC